MKVVFDNNLLIVTRRESDPKLYSESRLLYKIKQELVRQGYDVIKKEMCKDGHLVSSGVHYIRSRSPKDTNYIMIWDTDYAIRSLCYLYNHYNHVVLTVERDERR